MIQLKNITKSFKKNIIFENINLEIKEGDIILLKGINGCGKSTLLKILGKLMKADSGTITYDSEYNIGALIENPAFIEFKPLKYNLEFLFNLKNTYDQEKVTALCKLFQLDIDSKKVMRDYSVGMRQKAAIIQAVMENQNLILLDEPIRGLDEAAILNFYKLIQELTVNKDKIIVIASHDKLDEIKFNAKLEM